MHDINSFLCNNIFYLCVLNIELNFLIVSNEINVFQPVRMNEDSDPTSIPEDQWEKKAVYHVPDTEVEDNCPNRAELSLPRNLIIKASEIQADVSDLIY